MRILFLTFYYRPDLCAGAFRATPLAHALSGVAPAGSVIDVVTTVPNRYASFSAVGDAPEVISNVAVHRIALPAHRSGMVDQSKAFAAYARGVLKFVRGREYDIVFGTSSRLMTAALAAWIARQKRARLYLDIRDIFADTMGDLLRPPVSTVVASSLSALERWTVRRAGKVNLVSKGFAEYFSARYPDSEFTYHPNGIDAEFLAEPVVETRPAAAGRPVSVLYAGNIGEGQGLHIILPGVAKQLGARVRFKVIGDGGRRPRLVEALSTAGVDNVEITPPLQRSELLDAYRAADVLFLHLNDVDAFRKVLPSKIFEYAALGKPIWAGVAGYAAEFLRSEVDNTEIFSPCDVAGAVAAFERLDVVTRPRPGFVAKYERDAISRRMAADIIALEDGG